VLQSFYKNNAFVNANSSFCLPDRCLWQVQRCCIVLFFCSVSLRPVFSATQGSGTLAENPFYMQVWTADDGLPENRVVGVTQTSDGYLWVLTRGGLMRFDGVQFQPFESANSAGFITSTMWNLYLDRQGRQWIDKAASG
jgi:hypothetical protein